MSAPSVPPPVAPPPPQDPKKWWQNQHPLTWFFVLFMLLVGAGILITKTTGFSFNNPTPTAVAAKAATPKPDTPHATRTTPPTPTIDPTIKVYVTGEVLKPDVYVMRSGDRIEDAINLAGGFTGDADKTRLDLAQRVKDEMHIVVPAKVAPGTPSPPGGITLPAGTMAQTSPGKAAANPTRTPGKINLNTASAADLESLPGIGEVLAQRIVEYRTKNGPFKVLDDLKKVQGVNKATLDKIKDLVTF